MKRGGPTFPDGLENSLKCCIHVTTSENCSGYKQRHTLARAIGHLMIRLNRSPSPPQLTVALAQHLTNEFLADKTKRVWAKQYIQDALLAFSHTKCAYCETRLEKEAQYLEVEHYKCKAIHPNLVAEWTNLLPSCKRCNGQKGEYDVIAQGDLIEPTIDSPRDHLQMSGYRLIAKDDKGKRAIKVLYLNQSTRLVKVRYDVGNAVGAMLEQLNEDWEKWEQTADDDLKRRVLRGLSELLEEALPEAEFSATTATVLEQNPLYQKLKDGMMQQQLWDADFVSLHQKALAQSLA
jgi:uncharacterized protein (TIGR02646 family)